MYLNGELIFGGHHIQYDHDIIYNSNYVGSEAIIINEGKTETVNCFRGQMSALYFISIDVSTYAKIHKVLEKTFSFICMSQLFSVLSFEEAYKQTGIHFKKLISYRKLTKRLQVERIFLRVVPKNAKQLEIAVEDLHNDSQKLFQHTRVLENISARSILANCLGINSLFPFLFELGQPSQIPSFAKIKLLSQCLEIIKRIWEFDHHNKCSLGKINEEIINLRYLLGRIANKVELPMEIYAILRSSMENIEIFYSDSAENYLEMIITNMNIWKYSSEETQIKIAEDISKYLTLQTHNNLRTPKVIDILLDCIENFANYENDFSSPIKVFSAIILLYGEKTLTKEIYSIIMGYLNVYFLRRLKHFPKQIYCVLSIFMELFNSCKKQSIDIILDLLSSQKEVKQFAIIFTILDFFIQFKEKGLSDDQPEISITFINQRKENKEEGKGEEKMLLRHLPISISDTYAVKPEDNNYHYCEIDEDSMIDAILAMCIYWILTFDWKILSIIIRNYPRDDLFLFLLKQFAEANNENVTAILLSYIFAENKERKQTMIGIYCYTALISFALYLPFKSQENPKEKTQSIKNIINDQNNPICIKWQILEYILNNFNCFDLRAKNALLFDLEILALSEKNRFILVANKNNNLVNLIFSLAEYPEAEDKIIILHNELICFNYYQDGYFDDFTRICLNLKGSANYKLKIIDKFIETMFLMEIKQEPKLGRALLLFMFILEDSMLYYPNGMDQKSTFLLFCRIFYLLHITNWLYVSLPSIGLFDERCCLYNNLNTNPNNIASRKEIVFREGGFVRIILKLLIKMINYDKTENKETIFLLRFYLLREKEFRKYVKEMAKVGRIQKDFKEKIKYNLIDLILRQNLEKMKIHCEIMDFFKDKVINNGYTLLNIISQSSIQSTRNIFESKAFYFIYLLASFAQISHYEIFDINNYKSLPIIINDSTNLLNKISSSGLNENNKKMMMLAQLFNDVVKSKSLNDDILYLGSALSSEFSNLIFSVEKLHHAYFFSKNVLKISTVYNFLDQNFVRKESVIEEKALNIQEQHYDLFKKSMPYRIELIIRAIINAAKPGEFCDKYAHLILSEDYIRIIQPYLLFLTSHNFLTIDNFIASLSKHENLKQNEENKEITRLSLELRNKISESYGFITVSKVKIGNFS